MAVPQLHPAVKGFSLRTLDDTDRQIIALLRVDLRQPNTELAAALGMAEATVAARIRSLEADGAIRIAAQRDFRSAGFEILASVDLGVRGRALADVARDVAAVERVAIVTLVMGDKPLMLLVLAKSLQDLHDTVTHRLARIEGVVSSETMIISNIVKYRTEFAALSPLAQAS
ncbi:MAG: transcriptional regulator, AsnC family [Polaromonas sp.]|jgi:Lrp/AsnC family transcriptional regulator for asnA, asnC and gidA|nr:transcriptional regulator, AsnC family [Polaromonas sp.]